MYSLWVVSSHGAPKTGAARNKWLLDASEVQVYFDDRKVLPSYSPAKDGNRLTSVASMAHFVV
jgi:hypothetical protein